MPVSSAIVRRGIGDYVTADGLFAIWHEARSGHEGRWYVNHRDFDETLYLGGFTRKREAVKWLKKQYAERPDYLFGEYTAESPKNPKQSWLAATPKAEHMNRMIESMETYTKHKIECWVCNKSDSVRDTTDAKFARKLYQAGWRYVSSEKCQTSGVACPKCAANPDAECR